MYNKVIGNLLIVIGLIAIITTFIFAIVASHQYTRDYGYHQKLYDQSTTIDKRIYHISNFIDKVSQNQFDGKHNSLFLKRHDNSFEENLELIKTFKERLIEIKETDYKTIEYQLALYQFLDQERNKINRALDSIKGIWFKENYILLWNGVCAIQIIVSFIIFIGGIVFIFEED